MAFNKLNIIHIHTDYKFVRGSTIYYGEYFENTIIIIQNNTPYEGPFKDTALLLGHSSKDINKIVKICINADLVILYDLDKVKSKIVLKLPHDIRIAWRFFGYELYGKQLLSYISKNSRLVLGINKIPLHKHFINILRKGFNLIKYGRQDDGLFYNAIKRITYFLALSPEEYDDLANHWDDLPEFLKLPLAVIPNNPNALNLNIEKERKKPVVIIGNSKSVYNNHLDIIRLIDQESNKYNFNFTILFNYGQENNYSDAVRKATSQKNYYTIVEEFIPFEDFNFLYKKATALVINGYRQMALFNIFLGLQNGVKIYLNNRNIILQWLAKEGFYVFTVEDFVKDLQNNNLTLSNNMAHHNLNQSLNYSKKYTALDYQKVLHSKLIENNFTIKKK